jgi:hypothetical protein
MDMDKYEPNEEPRGIVVNHCIPKDTQIGVVDMKVRYIQNNDTWGSSDKYQQVIMETKGVEFSEKENTDSFIRMGIGPETPDEVDIENFWSINGLEDFAALFNDFEERRKSNIRYEVIKRVTLPDGSVEEKHYK